MYPSARLGRCVLLTLTTTVRMLREFNQHSKTWKMSLLPLLRQTLRPAGPAPWLGSLRGFSDAVNPVRPSCSAALPLPVFRPNPLTVPVTHRPFCKQATPGSASDVPRELRAVRRRLRAKAFKSSTESALPLCVTWSASCSRARFCSGTSLKPVHTSPTCAPFSYVSLARFSFRSSLKTCSTRRCAWGSWRSFSADASRCPRPWRSAPSHPRRCAKARCLAPWSHLGCTVVAP